MSLVRRKSRKKSGPTNKSKSDHYAALAKRAREAKKVSTSHVDLRPGGRFVDKHELLRRVPYSWGHICKLIKLGLFPEGDILFGKRVWPDHVIDAAIQQLPEIERLLKKKKQRP